jgi:hypothetical protein
VLGLIHWQLCHSTYSSTFGGEHHLATLTHELRWVQFCHFVLLPALHCCCCIALLQLNVVQFRVAGLGMLSGGLTV